MASQSHRNPSDPASQGGLQTALSQLPMKHAAGESQVPPKGTFAVQMGEGVNAQYAPAAHAASMHPAPIGTIAPQTPFEQ